MHLAISATPVAVWCIKLSTPPCNLHKQTLAVEWPYWRVQSDFQLGTVIGCHLSNKSSHQISALLEHETHLGWIGKPTESQNLSPDLTNARGWMEASPCSNVPTSSGKPCQKSGGCYSSKGGDQLHINAHDFGMRCSTSTYFWPCSVVGTLQMFSWDRFAGCLMVWQTPL